MKALFVIDMQNICVGEKHGKFFKYDSVEIVKSVNKAIEENKNNTVIYIRNLMKRNLINKLAPFQVYEGMEEGKLVENLNVISEYVFDKYEGNALSNDKLVNLLHQKNIDEIEVVGVDGGGCVALTALGAIKAGYKVIVNTKAIGTMFVKKEVKYYERLRKEGAKFI